MSRTQTIILFLFLIILSLILSSLPDEIVPRFVNDSFDMSAYQDRGSWVVNGQRPYIDVFSEYPQLATYMFAIPHVLGRLLSDSADAYRYVFSLMMALCLGITIHLVYELRNDRKYLALLMLLPASVYFTHNRYDIVPTMFTLIGTWMLFKSRFQLASFFLAVSVMFKWYPLVLFPVFLAHYYSINRRINWRMIATFSVTIGLVILPTLLSAGWEGFLVPYRFHLDRGVNRESIVFLVVVIMTAADIFNDLVTNIVYGTFLLLQVAVPFFSFLGRVREKLSALAWISCAILCFMLFAKYYSPQWLLWILPFLILRAQTGRDILMIVLFDLLTYLKFPIAFDGTDQTQFGAFDILIIANVILLIYFVYRAFSEIRAENGFSFRLRRST